MQINSEFRLYSDLFKLYVALKKAKDTKQRAACEENIRSFYTTLDVENFSSQRAELVKKFTDIFSNLGVTIKTPQMTELKKSDFSNFDYIKTQSELSDFPSEISEGISVVTCSKNRTENLIKALPSWLVHERINEIIIVDWCSDISVSQLLDEAGFRDPRIKVVRIEDEPRWILSYAFNIGLKAVSYSSILKVDADIVLSRDFFKKNILWGNCFIAGNWRNAQAGQAFVNGFVFVPFQAVKAVNGYNEYIRTYGWDDDDFYDRLVVAGYQRQDVARDTVYHLDHDDDARLAAEDTPIIPKTMREELSQGTQIFIHTNRYIASLLPRWSPERMGARYEVLSSESNMLTLKRAIWDPNPVAEYIETLAKNFALRDLLSWKIGQRVLEIDINQLDVLLEKHPLHIGAIDAELLFLGHSEPISHNQKYCVIDVTPENLEQSRLDFIFKLCKRLHLTPVMQKNGKHNILNMGESLASIPVLPSYINLGAVDILTLDQASALKSPVSKNLKISTNSPATTVQSAFISNPKPKLYIDAQHGLGNRLRAIASAASIANASDRELVIIWERDHHCDCDMSDLFEYDGALLNQSILNDPTISNTASIYNYMEIEPGAEKDRVLDLATQQDIYARSAYVLNSQLTSWDKENAYLKTLRPVERVNELVASVRSPNDVSAHIRMVGAAGTDTASYDSPENWTTEGHAQLHYWRAKSHFSHFMKRLDALIKENRANSVFIAADKPETYKEFLQAYGDRVTYLKRDLYDRSSEQLIYALADALLLGKAPLLLGSSWSSFSEIAMRMSNNKITVEMSGKDF